MAEKEIHSYNGMHHIRLLRSKSAETTRLQLYKPKIDENKTSHVHLWNISSV